jgi:phosphate transport system substrate-binding protein
MACRRPDDHGLQTVGRPWPAAVRAGPEAFQAWPAVCQTTRQEVAGLFFCGRFIIAESAVCNKPGLLVEDITLILHMFDLAITHPAGTGITMNSPNIDQNTNMEGNHMIKKVMAFILLAGLLLSAAACTTTTSQTTVTTTASQTTVTTTASQTTSNQNAALSGKVIIDGSGTVYPLMAHIAEQYMTKEQPDVDVQVGRAGSSAGFKKFIPGETDFSDASRAIKQEEIDQLKENGLEYGVDIFEFKLALDGLTIVINKDNTWAQEMTKDEIVNMYLAGHFKADDKVLWSDVRADWPAEQINFYGPNENHGTYEFFYENILDKKDMVTTVNLQQEYSTLVDLVSKDINAIAFFGFGYYVSNKDKLTAVKVDFGSGPVEPTLDTIGEDLPYAGFTRPVFTYLNVTHAKDKPQVLDYAKYVVSSEGAAKLAGENGFAPLPQAQYDAYLQQLNEIG